LSVRTFAAPFRQAICREMLPDRAYLSGVANAGAIRIGLD
jgi:hypothetical protein